MENRLRILVGRERELGVCELVNKVCSYQCSWTLSDLCELCSSDDSGENIAMACDMRRQKAVVMRVGCQEKRSEPGTAV